MKIKVIGTGSSGNAYVIDDGATRLLLDAGVPYSEIRRKAHTGTLSAALITHSHGDHCKAVADLVARGVDVYALPDVFLSCGVGNPTWAHPVHPMIHEDGVIERTISIGTLEVVPFRLEHDVPNVGWWIYSSRLQESMVYFTDTSFIRYKFPSMNYLLAECNYVESVLNDNVANDRLDAALAKRIRSTHMSLGTLLEMLDANDLSNMKQVYLIHLSDGNSNEEEILTEVRRKCGCEVIVA